MHTLWQDLRYALRTLRRSPGFTAVAVLALALGIGANTAIFSLIEAVLLRPLPFEKQEQLVQIWMRFTGIGIPKDQNWVSPPELMDLRQHARAFSHMAAFAQSSYNIRISDLPERLSGADVSPEFFPMLGVRPHLGRLFRSGEDTPGSDAVALLGHTTWKRRFGGDPAVVGRSYVINGRSVQIVGVMPPGFEYPPEAEIWMPLAFTPQQLSPSFRGNHGLLVLARIRDGLSFAQARADMDNVSERIIEGTPQYPYRKFGFRVLMNPLLEEVVGDVRTALWILMGAVALVLLIACANVANLLVARAAARERELAVRQAVGAGQARLVRQLLTESILLAGLGAALGVLLGAWGVRLLTSLTGTTFPRLPQAQINGTVLFFTIALSLATAVIFGLAPAWHAVRDVTPDALKEGGRGGTAGPRQRMRGLLVAAEVALSLMLLAGSGLLIRSFLRLQQVDPGFRPANVLTMRMVLPGYRYGEAAQIRQFYRALREKVARLPGVEGAGLISGLPLTGQGGSGTTTIDTTAVPLDQTTPEADRRAVTPGLCETLEIQLIRGRYFDERDNENSAPVAIIDETMARTYWPGHDAVGQRLKFGGRQSTSPWRTIVGVVRHVRFRTLEAPSRVEVYWPHAQLPTSGMSLAVRTGQNPRTLADTIQREVASLDPEQPVYAVRTVEELMSTSMARRRVSMVLLAVFGGIALLLAAVGIYGVIAYVVNQRVHEIGIRMALGARAFQVLRVVLGRSLAMVAAGLAVGLAASVFLTRFMSTLLFGIQPGDPATLAAVSAALVAVALVASYLPARRATSVDPVIALREE